jgi:hypothetical protein
VASLVDDGRGDAGEGQVHEPGTSGVAPGSGVIMWPPVLGLPEGVDDRAAPAADVLVVPLPGGRIDRLADGPRMRRLLRSYRSGCAAALASATLISERMAVGAV